MARAGDRQPAARAAVKPPKTGPTKYVAHLLGDDKASLWCGHKPGHRHRIAITVERVTCRKCKRLMREAMEKTCHVDTAATSGANTAKKSPA